MTDNQPAPVGCWRRRRRIVHLGLIFCAATIGYCLWRGEDTELYRVALTNAFYAGVAIFGSYVFGATWDDANARKAGK